MMVVFFAIVLFCVLGISIIGEDESHVPAKTFKTVVVIAEIACICGCLLFEDGVWAPGLWTATIAVVSIVYLNKQDKIQKDSNQTKRTPQTTARTTSTRTASTSRTYASTPSPTPSAPVLRRSDAPDITISGVRVITKETVSLFPNLRNLTIGSGVQEIAKSAFMAHPTLYSVTFASDINKIGEDAFVDCLRLTRIHGITRVREIGDYAFQSCYALESVDCDNKHTSLLTSIGAAAFGGCRALKAFEFPESLRTIGRGAFVLCEALKFSSLPKSLKVIEKETFSKCKSLESVSFSTGITHIGERAFDNCESLKSVSFSKGLTHIDKSAFFNCGITSLHIPDTVISIGSQAFNLNQLQTVSIPNSVTDIGDDALSAAYPADLNYIKMPVRFKERAPQIINFYEYLSPSNLAKITYIQ